MCGGQSAENIGNTNQTLQKERQINKLKSKNKELINEKVNEFYNEYNSTVSASKFQLNEALTKEAQIKDELNQKKDSFKENVESEIKNNLKSLGF